VEWVAAERHIDHIRGASKGWAVVVLRPSKVKAGLNLHYSPTDIHIDFPLSWMVDAVRDIPLDIQGAFCELLSHFPGHLNKEEDERGAALIEDNQEELRASWVKSSIPFQAFDLVVHQADQPLVLLRELQAHNPADSLVMMKRMGREEMIES